MASSYWSQKRRVRAGLFLVLLMGGGLAGCGQSSDQQPVQVQAETETLELRAPNCPQEASCTTVTIKREIYAQRPALNQSVKEVLLDQLQGFREAGEASVGTSLEQVAQDFINEAEKVAEMSAANWQLNGEVKTLARTGDLLTVAISSYIYSGGAHGMPVTQWLNWDLATDTEVKLADVIAPQQENAFWQLAQAEHQQWLEEMSADEGFRQNWPFQRSEDFRFTQDGLVLRYGVYTLGPYSIGEVELVLPRKKLTGLLKASYLPQPAMD